jgi:hypothetical protein
LCSAVSSFLPIDTKQTTQGSTSNSDNVLCDMIQFALCNLFEQLSETSINLINPEFETGLSTSLAVEIAGKFRRYTDEATLSADYSHLSEDIVNYIFQVIGQILCSSD